MLAHCSISLPKVKWFIVKHFFNPINSVLKLFVNNNFVLKQIDISVLYNLSSLGVTSERLNGM